MIDLFLSRLFKSLETPETKNIFFLHIIAHWGKVKKSKFFPYVTVVTLFHSIKKGPLKYSLLFCRFWRIYEFFFKIPKIQKLYTGNILAIFLRVVWTLKRSKWSLKSQKTRFFKAFLRGWKRLEKNVFFEILRTTSIFSMFKLLSKILHGYYTTFVFLEFWKNSWIRQNWQNKWEYFSFLKPLNNSLTIEKMCFFLILRTTSIFSMFKLLSKILHGYYTANCKQMPRRGFPVMFSKIFHKHTEKDFEICR